MLKLLSLSTVPVLAVALVIIGVNSQSVKAKTTEVKNQTSQHIKPTLLAKYSSKAYNQGFRDGQAKGRQDGASDGAANGGRGSMHINASCEDFKGSKEYGRGFKDGCFSAYRKAFIAASKAVRAR